MLVAEIRCRKLRMGGIYFLPIMNLWIQQPKTCSLIRKILKGKIVGKHWLFKRQKRYIYPIVYNHPLKKNIDFINFVVKIFQSYDHMLKKWDKIYFTIKHKRIKMVETRKGNKNCGNGSKINTQEKLEIYKCCCHKP